MANRRRPQQTRPRRSWLLAGLVVIICAGAVLFAYRQPIAGYGSAGTAYMARVACSCRFVAGRSMEECENDRLEGAELIVLSEDEDERSVTASLPLIAQDRATYREGYGCVLQPWEG